MIGLILGLGRFRLGIYMTIKKHHMVDLFKGFGLES
jgi:hypothetical protein